MKTPQKAISQLITQKEILEELKELGVGAGMILEVHASLSAFGYVCGGAQTVVNALIEAVGYSGTLLMAMQCSDNTEPSAWENPPTERHLIKAVREQMPAFNKKNRIPRGWGRSLRICGGERDRCFPSSQLRLCRLGQIRKAALQSSIAAFSAVGGIPGCSAI